MGAAEPPARLPEEGGGGIVTIVDSIGGASAPSYLAQERPEKEMANRVRQAIYFVDLLTQCGAMTSEASLLKFSNFETLETSQSEQSIFSSLQ